MSGQDKVAETARPGWRGLFGKRADTLPATPRPDIPPELIHAGPVHDYAAEAFTLSTFFDFARDEIAASVAACAAAPAGALARIAWFVPHFETAAYGGVHTILRVADHMRRSRGVAPVFVVIGAPDAETPRARIAAAFPEMAATAEVVALARMNEYAEIGPVDAAVATMWMTALAVLRLEGARRKFYFLQDWEPLLYPAGTTSALVESSYRFGFHAICNTETLALSYRECGGVASWFQPAVDGAVFHAERPKRSQNAPLSLFCYARPGQPRNCFEALAGGLHEVKRQLRSGVDIVTAGADWDPALHNLAGVVRNLGMLSIEETGELYRRCDVGLVAMATRHPSYLPLELMACGVTVVTNRNPATAWLLRERENCLLCEMSRSDIADTILDLVDDVALRQSLAAGGVATIAAAHGSWTAACDQIADQMAAVCETPA